MASHPMLFLSCPPLKGPLVSVGFRIERIGHEGIDHGRARLGPRNRHRVAPLWWTSFGARSGHPGDRWRPAPSHSSWSRRGARRPSRHHAWGSRASCRAAAQRSLSSRPRSSSCARPATILT